MADKKKINIDNMEIDKDDYEYEKKLAEEERERQRQIEEKAAERKAEAVRKKREAERQREQQIQEEKLELLRLKSGIKDENDSELTKNNEEVHEKPTGMAAVSNFWYHYKTVVVVCSIICAVIGYAIYSEVTKERADLTIIVTSNCGLEQNSKELEEFFEKYTDDVDGNGYVHVGIIDVPMSPIIEETMQNTYMQKLTAQIQVGEGMIMITDSYTKPECVELLNNKLSDDFPGNKYIDDRGFSFDSKVMAEELNFPALPNDVHMSIRNPVETISLDTDEAQELYDQSYVVFERIVNDITQKCEDSNDPGLENGPIEYELESRVEIESPFQ